ncbi:MAG: HD domain-containing protein [Pseudomonadota bacterium]
MSYTFQAMSQATRPSVFRDPVHGLIDFQGCDAAIGRLLDTRAVQRLRSIRQLGFASLVYPGAEHSRFGHALGTYHVASRVAARLGLEAEIARDLKTAALLHDVGHGPFSHAWETALAGPGHEEWGRRIVREDEELRGALLAVSAELPSALDRLFGNSYRPRFVNKLICSQLDADRMDYLLRDAYYTGVGYSTYDLDWVIYALRRLVVRPEDDDSEDLVVDHRRGLYALEQYLFGRFHMYAQVYYHKTVRAAERLFLAIMRRFAELARQGSAPPGLPAAAKIARGEALEVREYLELDDARVSCALRDYAVWKGDRTLADLAERLCSRRLFKTIEVADVAVATALAPALAELAARQFGSTAAYYWAIDEADWLGYDLRAGEEIYVVGHPRHGTVDLGQLLKEMPIGRTTLTVRIICAPELLAPFRALVGA